MTATPCNMIATCAALILVSSSAVAADNPTAGDQWERALLDAKKRGDLPGPKPGQRCLWSEKLGACLWHTPKPLLKSLTPLKLG